jgi:hypothetical protein
MPWLLARVVVVTAHQRAFHEALPVAAVLLKPFEIEDLDDIVARVLSTPRTFERRAQKRNELR